MIREDAPRRPRSERAIAQRTEERTDNDEFLLDAARDSARDEHFDAHFEYRADNLPLTPARMQTHASIKRFLLNRSRSKSAWMDKRAVRYADYFQET